ncbi:TetR/AcrR family transcriptional regulator [Marinicella meishanensis]|uniref:TetR/AcrR family transcriptional regulator n=1 Tax=Marinicella meishanensis TaxID=2873263 RepID=UPI001CBE957D|nr:TetR/AcrR family transcriptional regulator [Marinicella sp. NBU2979]
MAGGRQRSFDKQQALEQAMRVFWQKGYVGASLMDLTTSMGINKPSMYAAFGNKEQLFILATQNYLQNYAADHAVFLHQPDTPLITRLKNYLMSAVASQCGKDGPKGCYLSVCVTEAAAEDMPAAAQQTIHQAKGLAEQTLTQFFQQAQAEQQLSETHDPVVLAQYFVTWLHGTAAMARADKCLTELEATIDLALKVIEPKPH